MSFIAQYRSPANETSVIKNVPIEHLVRSRSEVRDAFPGRRITTRFRGPRRDTMRLYCLKRDALRFSVYID
jgi:hypothetical protein